MECKINLPKDQLDKLLLEQITELKKQNAALQKKLDRANTTTAYTDQQREQIGKMYRDFKEFVEKWADHEDCRQ